MKFRAVKTQQRKVNSYTFKLKVREKKDRKLWDRVKETCEIQ